MPSAFAVAGARVWQLMESWSVIARKVMFRFFASLKIS